MVKIISKRKPPVESEINNFFAKSNYCDCYIVDYYKSNISIDDVCDMVFRMPNWFNIVLKIRDVLVKPFGLKTSDTNTNECNNSIPFNCIYRTQKEIIMHENDKHLDFWLSVLYIDNKVSITTIVKYNNMLGKVYFFIVKPFHRFFLKMMLSRNFR
jgi:hypothetical protein